MLLVYLVCLLSLVWCGFCEVVEPVPVAVPVDSHIAAEQADDTVTGGGASGRPAVQELQDAIRKLIAQGSCHFETLNLLVFNRHHAAMTM